MSAKRVDSIRNEARRNFVGSLLLVHNRPRTVQLSVDARQGCSVAGYERISSIIISEAKRISSIIVSEAKRMF